MNRKSSFVVTCIITLVLLLTSSCVIRYKTPKIKVSQSDAISGFDCQFIMIETSKVNFVPVILCIPNTKEVEKFPLVIMVHGFGGFKEDWISRDNEDTDFANQCLLNNFAVLAFDLKEFGERNRDIAKNKKPNYTIIDEEFVLNYAMTDLEDIGRYLLTRPEIDISRVGIIGNSLGGIVSLAALSGQTYFKTGVACSTPARLDYNVALSPANSAAKINDQPVLLLAGKKDPLCYESEQRQLFDLLHTRNKKILFYDSGHQLPDQAYKDALDWFKRYL